LLPVTLLALGSPHLPNGLTSIMASSELPAGIVCAGLFAGSVITPAVGAGAALVLAGIVLSQLDDLKHLRARVRRN
jgi:drug/metabolite transporter (DMT)-like permease